jgi:hypothetical protein
MTQLLVAAYDSDQAECVLGVLRAQADQLSASVGSAVVVRLQSDRRFTLIRTQHLGLSTVFGGVFRAALLRLRKREWPAACRQSSPRNPSSFRSYRQFSPCGS